MLVGATAVVLGAGAGVALGLLTEESWGPTGALAVALLVVSAYAARALNAWAITHWALRRTLGSLGLLFPLATRALPMLLLFVTFLFINTEVWQVASNLDGGVLWGTALLFGLAAIGFLLVRLDEELDAVRRRHRPRRDGRGVPYDAAGAGRRRAGGRIGPTSAAMPRCADWRRPTWSSSS